MNSHPSLLRCSFIMLLSAFGTDTLLAQENARQIDEPGSFTKYLTPASMDRWTFRGRKDETILVDLRTREFDSVLSLTQVTENSKETILHQADDDGSDCRLAFRLPADGDYKIGVTGFEQKGGGNYTLSMQKFLATEIQIDQLTPVEFDSEGEAYFYFNSPGDQFLTIDWLAQDVSDQCTMLDVQGAPIDPTGHLYELPHAGEYRLQLTNRRRQPSQLLLKSAMRDALVDASERTLQFDRKQAVVLDYAGAIGSLRMLELKSENELFSMFVFASKQPDSERSLDDQDQLPELSLLSEFDKGNRKHYAALLGRTDRYQLRMVSTKGGRVTLKITDPAEELAAGTTTAGRLSLGGTRFYRLHPKPGQTTTVRVRTEQFDPYIQLFDRQGLILAENDDAEGDGLNSYVRHTSYAAGDVILAVRSVGDGGGGDYSLSIRTEEPQSLALGEIKTREAGDAASDLWLFSAEQDQQVIFYCNSRLPVRMQLKNAQGLLEQQVDSQAESTGAVMLVKFPNSGDYSIELVNPSGESYTLQAISGN